MSEQLGKISPRKVPASQAIPGNAEHAKLIAQASKNKASKPTNSDWADKVKTRIFWPVLLGALIIFLFMGLFGFWAMSAPLSSATIVSGVVTAKGQNFTVQHFDGGIIKKILVREGDKVNQGQALIALDDTNAVSQHQRLTKSIIALKARIARLKAERDNNNLSFDTALIESAEKAGLKTTLDEQKREFEKRRERYTTDEKIIEQQISALLQQITGREIQVQSTKDQLAVLKQEIAVKKKLLKRKLTPKSTLLLLQRTYSELEGRLGQLTASIGESRSAIVQAKERQSRLQTQRAETAASLLGDIRRELDDHQERILTAKSTLNRVIIRAPSDGVVVELTKNTPGSVVRPGEDLAVILPSGGELIIEARLDPLDIDVVNVGQTANLRFSSLNTRTTPDVTGHVIYVSADRQNDAISGNPYYTARLSIAKKLPDNIRREQIFPGMPVEAYINIGSRTFVQYIAKPLTDSFDRAFKEE